MRGTSRNNFITINIILTRMPIGIHAMTRLYEYDHCTRFLDEISLESEH